MLCLSLLSFIISGCEHVQIKDSEVCSAAGSVSNGGLCTHLLNDEKRVMTLDEFLDFLEAKKPSGNDPGHGAAVCMASKDWGLLKTEAEIMCRMLGKRCSYDLRRILNLGF